MRAHESIWTTSLATLVGALAPLVQDGAGDDPRTSRWDVRDPVRAAEALASARGGGAVAARSALEGFEAASVAERRLRARVVRLECGPDEIARILALADDADRVVRSEIARAIGRPDVGDALRSERVAALARLADRDEDDAVRAAARTGLATLAAAAELAGLADRAPRDERAALLVELAGLPEARDAVRSRLRDDDGELALAGRIAAENAPGPGEDEFLARVDAGLARGSRPALAALERHVRRSIQLGAEDRALATLARFDDATVAELRARVALASGRDARIALDSARELRAARAVDEDPVVAALRVARAERLAACARLVLGESDDAGGLDGARAALDALLARRVERGAPAAAAEQLALLDEAAQVELCRAIRSLARTSEPDPSAAVDAAFELHRLALVAQAVATRAEITAADGLDRVLGEDDSAVELVLDREVLDPRERAAGGDALDADRRLAIRIALGRALATAAGPEVVGFEPIGAADPERIARRRALLAEVLDADVERAQARHGRAALAVERARVERPGGAPAALQQEELESRLALQSGWRDVAALAGGDDGPLADQRSASWFAVTTARRLRDAGRGADARALLSRARADLEASGAAQRWLWGIELVAEIEAATGASFTDDEEPRAAETELLRAVDRLKALEDLLRERGAPPRAVDAVKNQRANALVSLAVNANVRMGDPKRALEHFEAAWALRQDEFLRVLLACYRARSGRATEARAALATVAPGPGTYYNLACAWALLGERDVALRWLEKELRLNHAPGGGLERQKAWSRKDPDLASLRDDPRFLELVGK